MAVFIRAKRVSDPLDDRVKAQLLSRDDDRRRSTNGYASSGSEHDADDSSLSMLVHAFFDLGDTEGGASDDVATTDDSGDGSLIAEAKETIQDLLNPSKTSDPLGFRLRSDVMKAANAFAELKSSKSAYSRAVMARLRELGHSAGICKARWESSGGLTAGSYEYIDIVVSDGKEERYIVDLDFAGQFEIARATAEYEKLKSSLPKVMLAKAEEVKRAVRIMAEAVKSSLKSRDLSVPPWRKRRYMMNKWFGPYRRTVNPLPSSAGVPPAVAGRGDIQCRAVGFEPATPRIVPALRLRGTR